MSTRSGVGRRPGAVLVLLLCIPLMTVSCDWLRGRFGRPGISPPPPESARRADVRAALLSVYYHAYGLDLLMPRPKGKPIPLAEAAAILADDTSQGAAARRRRAIAKLAAGEVLRPRAGALRPALDILVPDRAFDVDDLLVELPHVAALPADSPVPLPMFHEGARLLFGERTTLVLAFLDSHPDLAYGRQCCAGVVHCQVDNAANSTDEASVYFVLEVRRSVGSLRPYLDPQMWDECAPDYFHDAHHQSDTCSDETDLPDLPLFNLLDPSPGEGWDGALYEHFQADFAGGISTWFTNRLQICGDWDATNEMYRYHYGLCRPVGSLKSSVLGDGPMDGGLKKDCGLLRAWDADPSTDAPDWTRVDGIKALRFDTRPFDPGMGLWANLGLELMVDGMADTAVCCGATDGTECKVADEQCIQGKSRSVKWPPAPACEVQSSTSPDCSEIEK